LSQRDRDMGSCGKSYRFNRYGGSKYRLSLPRLT
jgi:hypothetical protein